jgi:hypothetical protein
VRWIFGLSRARKDGKTVHGWATYLLITFKGVKQALREVKPNIVLTLANDISILVVIVVTIVVGGRQFDQIKSCMIALPDWLLRPTFCCPLGSSFRTQHHIHRPQSLGSPFPSLIDYRNFY